MRETPEGPPPSFKPKPKPAPPELKSPMPPEAKEPFPRRKPPGKSVVEDAFGLLWRRWPSLEEWNKMLPAERSRRCREVLEELNLHPSTLERVMSEYPGRLKTIKFQQEQKK